MERRTLVLGVGNILVQDEGLGVRALERLQASHRLPSEVSAIDGGTMGLDLLPYLDGITHLLILDAVHGSRPPGALVRLEGEAIPVALAMKLSVHQIGLQELLAVARFQGTLPGCVVVWGMQPASLDPGIGLSEPVRANLDELVEAAARELALWAKTTV